MAGDVTKKLDPYFPFEKSVEQWGFVRRSASYEGASMNLDLLDRKGKYSNGFATGRSRRGSGLTAAGSRPFALHLADPAAVVPG